jgi:hypothetical protein
MNYLPSKRGTLLVLSGTHVDPDKHHLFVICTDECDNGNFLIAPLCTWTNSYCDPTCILQPHEHQFIKQKSYVLYRKCRLISRTDIERGIEQSTITPKEDLNAQTFLKVRNGITKSPATPNKLKTYMRTQIQGN